jgi:chromosomal replication initiator protein
MIPLPENTPFATKNNTPQKPAELTNKEKMRQTFDNFLYNQKNQDAVNAAKLFAQGGTSGIIILNGPEGSGKSHLLQAIRIMLLEHFSKQEIFFSNNLVKQGDFAETKNLDNFSFLRYILLDNLPAEDISRFLSLGDIRQNGVFFHNDAKNYALALNGSMNQKIFERLKPEKFINIISLSTPDMDIRLRHIQNISKSLNLEMENIHILDLARTYTDLESIYKFLYSKHLEYNKKTIFNISEQKNNKLKKRQKKDYLGNLPITPEDIIFHTAEYFKLEIEQIKSESRLKKVVLARQISMYLCRKLLGSTLKLTGKFLNKNNHTSIIYSINKISNLYKSNKNMHNIISELEKNINPQKYAHNK